MRERNGHIELCAADRLHNLACWAASRKASAAARFWLKGEKCHQR